MADVLTPAQRSLCMSRIRSKDTRPELAVRAGLQLLGIRYRLHRKNLPGNPDIVIPSQATAIFVHGCFWHRHRCRLGRATPSSNIAFWETKFAANRLRDRRSVKALRALGWRVVTVWECTARKPQRLVAALKRAVANSSGSIAIEKDAVFRKRSA
jgi:DNA mismatch endonuclease (patch repair protein)